ncbi:MAG: LysE/ArgO family amino acid transporter [Gammaproteobacteria bacterium]
MTAFRSGLFFGLSLIISLGPQNLFLVRQGLTRQYVYLCASVCFICDVILILLSTQGLSYIIEHAAWLKVTLLIAGSAFLALYGINSIRSAIKRRQTKQANITPIQEHIALSTLLLTCLSFSLLNPQAIIDTVILIGSTVMQYPTQSHWGFILGTLVASLVWFFSLATIARSCSKYLTYKLWSNLELLSGTIMLFFAAKLASMLTV